MGSAPRVEDATMRAGDVHGAGKEVGGNRAHAQDASGEQNVQKSFIHWASAARPARTASMNFFAVATISSSLPS